MPLFTFTSAINTRNEDKLSSQIFRFLSTAELRRLYRINSAWSKLGHTIVNIRTALPSHFDETKKATMADALVQAIPVNSNIPITISPIIGGHSPWASTYRVTTGDQQLVLRIIDAKRDLSARKKETRVARELSARNITPHVFYSDANDGVILQQFITSVPRWYHQLTPVLTNKLTQKIKDLNALKYAPTRDASYDATGFLVQKKDKILSVLKLHPQFYLYQQLLVELERLASFQVEEVLTHNNFHTHNILFDGAQFWIIDLESVCKGDLYLDLSMLSASARFKPETEKDLLEAYFSGKLNDIQNARYYLSKVVSLLSLAASFFASCKDYSALSDLDFDKLPNFSMYNLQHDGTCDINSDVGRFTLSIMLAKEALSYIATPKYTEAVRVLEKSTTHTRQPFWGGTQDSDFVPTSFDHRVFVNLEPKDLARTRLVSKDWHVMSRASLFARRQRTSIPLEMCPQYAHQIIMDMMQKNFVLDPKSPVEIRPLAGGLSPWANIFFVTFNQKKFVLRVLNPELSLSEKLREVETMKLFSHRGVTPLIEHVDLNHGVILMRHIENNPKWLMSMDKSKVLELARLLRSIHDVKLPKHSETFRDSVRMQQFMKKITHLNPSNSLKPLFDAVLSKYNELMQIVVMNNDSGITMCHYDMNPWNFLHDGSRLWAIDWEFSQLGHPYFDVATINNFLRLTPDNEQFLLTSYVGGSLTTDIKSTYHIMKQLSYLHYAICSLGLCKNSDMTIDKEKLDQLPPFQKFVPRINPPFAIDKNTDEGRTMIAVMFARQAFEHINQPMFKNAIEVLNKNNGNEHKLKPM